MQVWALAKLTIRARKSTRVSQGADPKRPAEPRRAEGRREGEAVMTARRPSRGGGLGIEARAEVARCAAKAWTAQYSTAQSMVGGTTATTVGDLELRVSEQPAHVLDDRHVVCPVGGLAPLCMTSTDGETKRNLNKVATSPEERARGQEAPR